MKSIDKTIGKRISQLRRLAGLSQARLADTIGIATETISRLETGAAMPSLARLAAIARVLGVELRELLRIRPGSEPKHAALDRLTIMMSRRTEAEIQLVIDISSLVLDHVRQHPSNRVSGDTSDVPSDAGLRGR